MKTVKPFRLSTLVRPYRWQGRDTLGVALLGLISLEAKPMLLPEQELWQLAAEEIGPGNVLDLGIPKMVPEMLVSGNAYTAHQQDKTACAVRVVLAGRQKALAVFGDRFELDGRTTLPQPFEAMRLDWAHAYGGPGSPENPQGMGRVDELINGVLTRRVPNVEKFGEHGASGRNGHAPAGLGAFPPDWPQRMQHLGTAYGQQWIEQQYPGFADDMDWRFFNAAPPDQRWTEQPELPAGAAYEIWNMHPTEPVLRGALPRWRARCFASWRKDGLELQETPLRLTTAWFFPHLRRAILIWHGSFGITEDDAADVKNLMPALELDAESRPLAHYQEVLQLRLDPASAIHAVRDSDLVPKSVMGAWAGDQMPDIGSRPLVRNQLAGQRRDYEKQHAKLKSEGLDPAKFLAPPVVLQGTLHMEDLPDLSAKAEQQIAQARDELKARSEKSMIDLDTESAAPETPSERRRFDPDQMIEELVRLEAFGKQEHMPGATGDGAESEAARARQRMASQIRQGHLYTAHLLDPAPAMTTFRAAKLRRRLSAVEPGQRRFAGANLVGADLSEMDLSGADFSGANLEDANLAGAVLSGCNFTRAVLARARLERATLTDAILDHANLGGAKCDGANFVAASLRHANCHKTAFRACVMAKAKFEATNMHESVWQQCDLRGTQWQQVAMMKMNLEDVSFDDAVFQQMGWIECTLIGVSFVRAAMSSCGFVAVNGSGGLDLTSAILTACSFSSDSNLAGVVLREATLKNCGLRGLTLTDADLRNARLDGCDFSECDLRGARLDRLSAGESLFVRTNFVGASLMAANLIDANLSKADLRMSNLENANLFRADVSQAAIDASTRLNGAYTHHAKVWPARRIEASP